MTTVLTALRRTLLALWIVLLVALVLLAAASHIAPLFGRSVYVIHGGSMSPTIPLGALVIDRPIPTADLASDLATGDVVTVREASGVIVTHRVARIAQLPGGPAIELKGDANAAPDAALVPATQLIGRVELSIPFLGYLLALMSIPTGMISAVSMLTSLFLAIWLLEEAEDELRRETQPQAVGAGSMEAGSAA